MLIKRIRILLALLILFCIFAVLWVVLHSGKSDVEADTVAQIGEAHILPLSLMTQIEVEFNNRYVQDDFQLQKKKSLDSMIQRHALLQTAVDYGLANDPEVVSAYEALLINRLKDKYLMPKLDAIEVDSEDILRYYTLEKQKYTQDARSRIAIIFLHVPANASDTTKSELRIRAETAHKKALVLSEHVKDFSSLAAIYSNDQSSRYQGGDVGWVIHGQVDARFPPEVFEALSTLSAIGEISEVIVTAKGFYLIRLIDTKPETTTPLNVVESNIRSLLVKQARVDAEQDWLRQVVADTPVSINYDVLNAIEEPAWFSTPPSQPVLPN